MKELHETRRKNYIKQKELHETGTQRKTVTLLLKITQLKEERA